MRLLPPAGAFFEFLLELSRLTDLEPRSSSPMSAPAFRDREPPILPASRLVLGGWQSEVLAGRGALSGEYAGDAAAVR